MWRKINVTFEYTLKFFHSLKLHNFCLSLFLSTVFITFPYKVARLLNTISLPLALFLSLALFFSISPPPATLLSGRIEHFLSKVATHHSIKAPAFVRTDNNFDRCICIIKGQASGLKGLLVRLWNGESMMSFLRHQRSRKVPVSFGVTSICVPQPARPLSQGQRLGSPPAGCRWSEAER